MARIRNDRHRRDTDAPAFGACLACRQENPDGRHEHYLALAQDNDLKMVEEHVYLDLLDRWKGDSERAARCAKDTIVWLTGQIAPFRHMVDERTGEVLPWWVARQQNIQAIHATSAAIGERARAADAERTQRMAHRIGTLARLEPAVGTPIPEPPPRPRHRQALEDAEGMPLPDEDDYTPELED